MQEMEEDIWTRLSEDLLFQILGRLPLKSILRFRAVCKRWNEAFQSSEFKALTANLVFCSTPAFLIVHKLDHSYKQSRWTSLNDLWIWVDSSYKFYRLALDFLPRPAQVVASCRSLLCCSTFDRNSNWLDENLCSDIPLYICNPVTRTWIELSKPLELTRWDFIGLTFDPCIRCCCMLIIGMNSTPDRDMLMEIYDSNTNEWTQFRSSWHEFVRPEGEGVYLNRKFYWLSDRNSGGESVSVVSLDVEYERQWRTIKGPEYIYAAMNYEIRLTGFEGYIVVVDEVGLCLWKLNIDEEGEGWSLLKMFGREYRMNNFLPKFAMNKSGCISVIRPSVVRRSIERIVEVWSGEGKTLERSLDFWGQTDLCSFESYSCFTIRAFEVDNIWWP